MSEIYNQPPRIVDVRAPLEDEQPRPSSAMILDATSSWALELQRGAGAASEDLEGHRTSGPLQVQLRGKENLDRATYSLACRGKWLESRLKRGLQW